MMSLLDEFSIKPSLKQSQIRKAFGTNIRERRQERNMSMEELARRALISQDLLLRIESGLVDPRVESIRNRLNHALESEMMVIA
jgi:predicted transcriptional regulator